MEFEWDNTVDLYYNKFISGRMKGDFINKNGMSLFEYLFGRWDESTQRYIFNIKNGGNSKYISLFNSIRNLHSKILLIKRSLNISDIVNVLDAIEEAPKISEEGYDKYYILGVYDTDKKIPSNGEKYIINFNSKDFNVFKIINFIYDLSYKGNHILKNYIAYPRILIHSKLNNGDISIGDTFKEYNILRVYGELENLEQFNIQSKISYITLDCHLKSFDGLNVDKECDITFYLNDFNLDTNFSWLARNPCKISFATEVKIDGVDDAASKINNPFGLRLTNTIYELPDWYVELMTNIPDFYNEDQIDLNEKIYRKLFKENNGIVSYGMFMGYKLSKIYNVEPNVIGPLIKRLLQ